MDAFKTATIEEINRMQDRLRRLQKLQIVFLVTGIIFVVIGCIAFGIVSYYASLGKITPSLLNFTTINDPIAQRHIARHTGGCIPQQACFRPACEEIPVACAQVLPQSHDG